MALSNAMLIASRGCLAAEASPTSAGSPASVEDASPRSGYSWASDPRLLQPSQLELTPEVATAFLRRISCPALVLTASDGIYRELLKRGGRKQGQVGGNGLPLAHAFGRPFSLYLVLLWSALRTCSRLLAWLRLPKQQKQLETIARHVREGWRVGARLHALKHFRYEELPSGGHHFHMTSPQETSNAIVSWLKS